MSTRAVYVFHDQHNEIAVYKHHDGYPSGAVQWIKAALPHAWPLPRFEALDRAVNYEPGGRYHDHIQGGGVRLMASSDKANFPGDIEYCYRVGADGHGKLKIEAFKVSWSRDDVATHRRIFRGSLNDMAAKFREV